MSSQFNTFFNQKIGWFILVMTNFTFGICGVIMCSLKLKHGSETIRADFFKLSIVFATCNLVLSVLLLVSVIKNNHKYAFFCAFLSFVSLFSAIIHVEIGTTHNITFIIVFIVIGISAIQDAWEEQSETKGILFLFWFCIFASYQVLTERKLAMEETYSLPIQY